MVKRSGDLSEGRLAASDVTVLVYNGSDFPPIYDALWPGPPPRWARTCMAGRQARVAEHLVAGGRIPRVTGGHGRCRFIGCPYCHPEVMRRRQRTLRERVFAAEGAGLSFSHLCLTCPSVPVGHLEAQRSAISENMAWLFGRRWVKSSLGYHEVVGRLYADHLTFDPTNGHHAHRHLLLAARGDAEVAGLILAEGFRQRLRLTGWQVNTSAAHCTAAPTPAGLISYLTRPWRPAPDVVGSFDPLGLAVRALLGDVLCRDALVEVLQTIRGRALFRGCGVLGSTSKMESHGGH